MDEERLLGVGVECYAGYRGEQTPRTLILGDRRIGVSVKHREGEPRRPEQLTHS
jgi:hypothetical protein